MPTIIITSTVDFCRRHALSVVLGVLAITVVMGWYAATHFQIKTDIDRLLSSNAEWRQREFALKAAFPQRSDLLVVVIDGKNPDVAENAATIISDAMTKETAFFRDVRRPDAIPFFRRNGLLFLPPDELSATLDALTQAQPFLGTIAADPSLRGLMAAVDMMLLGLERGAADYGMLQKPLELMAATAESVVVGKNRVMPWQAMMSANSPKPYDLRKIILAQPVLDYEALSPGAAASARLRAIVQQSGVTEDGAVRVRLTGQVALNDEEFASVADGMELAALASVLMVMGILWMALRSMRLIVPVLIVLSCGLVMTTAFAMAAVGSLNLISVAFAVMFVGIAVDFGIQFGVRYRDQHHREPDAARAMTATAREIAAPLSLAALATATGFLAFTPTVYRGVAELGLIAGAGMIIAFVLNITLLPALLALLRPPAEPDQIGYRFFAPLDRLLVRRSRTVLITAGVIGVLALGTASQIRFDFDPLNLKDVRTESVSTLVDLMRDPNANPYSIVILRPTTEAASVLADKISALPEVNHTMTLRSFIPAEQERKIAMLGDSAMMLLPTLSPPQVASSPDTSQTMAALQHTAETLTRVAGEKPEAARLAAALQAIITLPDTTIGDGLSRLDQTMLGGMRTLLPRLREMLMAGSVTESDISYDLRRDWITPDGQARIEVYPKGDARDDKTLAAFTKAVQAVASDAAGAPISIRESGYIITNAFIYAGILAVIAIAILGWLVLRRIADVAYMLLPLLLAASLTMATMVLIGLPLNFANIIALPLLLSLGVSYAVYFVSWKRDGLGSPLQSSMARAVIFSAGTTLAAFGSLAFSPHAGTSSMGVLLTLALVYSLLCTFLLIPALPDGKSRI